MNKTKLKTPYEEHDFKVGDIFDFYCEADSNDGFGQKDRFWILIGDNPAKFTSLQSGEVADYYEKPVKKLLDSWVNWRKLEKGETVEITVE